LITILAENSVSQWAYAAVACYNIHFGAAYKTKFRVKKQKLLVLQWRTVLKIKL